MSATTVKAKPEPGQPRRAHFSKSPDLMCDGKGSSGWEQRSGLKRQRRSGNCNLCKDDGQAIRNCKLGEAVHAARFKSCTMRSISSVLSLDSDRSARVGFSATLP